jgi:hypothetical protein
MKCLGKLPNGVLLIGLLFALIVMSGCFVYDLRITTSGLPDGTKGSLYDARVYANQYVDEWIVSSGLPPGISFSNSGHFSGTPTLAGTYSFTVEARQYGPGGDRAYKGFSILIKP